MPTSSRDTPAARARQASLGVLDRLRDRVAENEYARRIAYSIKNRQSFGDLRQHDRMLADSVRIEAYHAGLQKHVSDGDVVVDLGAGSGVLSCFAARAGAGRVHAIEHGQIADAAEAVARDNGLDGVIELHRMHSRRFELPEKADAIVHEQIGEALFDERVVENIVDLRDRVLKPGGLILPARLQLYIEPIEMTAAARCPYAYEQKLHGVDFRALEPFAQAQPPEYRYYVYRPFPFGKFLAEREPAVEVDLQTVGVDDLPTELTFERTVTVDGTLDGMVVYFSAGFDDEIWFSSSPDGTPTSWGSPLLRTSSRAVEAGDTIEFSLQARNLVTASSWRWQIGVRPAAG